MHKHESPWIFGRSIIPIERRLPDRPNVFSQELSNKGSDSTEKKRNQQDTHFHFSPQKMLITLWIIFRKIVNPL